MTTLLTGFNTFGTKLGEEFSKDFFPLRLIEGLECASFSIRITCSILSKSVASSDSGEGLAVSTTFDGVGEKGIWLLSNASMPSCTIKGFLAV